MGETVEVGGSSSGTGSIQEGRRSPRRSRIMAAKLRTWRKVASSAGAGRPWSSCMGSRRPTACGATSRRGSPTTPRLSSLTCARGPEAGARRSARNTGPVVRPVSSRAVGVAPCTYSMALPLETALRSQCRPQPQSRSDAPLDKGRESACPPYWVAGDVRVSQAAIAQVMTASSSARVAPSRAWTERPCTTVV